MAVSARAPVNSQIPCSHRQRLVAAEGSDEASGCGRVEVESRHIRDEDADPFPPGDGAANDRPHLAGVTDGALVPPNPT